jgi:hypothetical protein
MKSVKLVIEVTAGLRPGLPEPQFTRRWTITSDEWEQAQAEDDALLETGDNEHAVHAALLLAFRAAEADEYARLLRNPQRFNWVRTEWEWL